MDAIATESLVKRYGDRRGIDGVSLRVPAGSLFGFIGPNGAGKTTTIRILLGLLFPTAGHARLFGRDVVADGPAARAGVGYVPGESHVYPDLRVGELLAFLGRFHAGDPRRRRAELAEALDLDLGARAIDLSLGNRKKVAITAALQHRPRLVVLDEPTNGLDPVVRAGLFDLLRAEAAAGTTVFFSSHALAEVQAVCQQVAVLREGRLVAVDDVEALRGRETRRVSASFERGGSAEVLAGLPGIDRLSRDGTAVTFLYDGAMPALLRALAAAAPSDVRIEEPSLEEIFLRHYAPRAPGGHHVDA